MALPPIRDTARRSMQNLLNGVLAVVIIITTILPVSGYIPYRKNLLFLKKIT
jgi:hypothetical protein